MQAYQEMAYNYRPPLEPAIPLLISAPHCGAAFPDDLQGLRDEPRAWPDDTDWFLDQLYDFAPNLGAGIISSRYCRYVIDLNRDPADTPLYNDGRSLTSLVPTTDFLGRPLYQGEPPGADETQRRLERYYKPYHDRLQKLLQALKLRFGVAVLWEAHSIRRHVPTIHLSPFPELILSDARGQSCGEVVFEAAREALAAGTFTLAVNEPFSGGYITRQYGNPDDRVHALQLEMVKTNYMDDDERRYDPDRAEHVRDLLRAALRAIAVAVRAR